MTDLRSLCEVAREKGVHPRHAQRLAKEGRIEAVLIGRIYLVRATALDGQRKHRPRQRKTREPA